MNFMKNTFGCDISWFKSIDSSYPWEQGSQWLLYIKLILSDTFF
jgi:hypothetical protein